MKEEAVLIPVMEPHSVIGAARVFAVLAYPLRREQLEREEFVSAVLDWLAKRYLAVRGTELELLGDPRRRNDSINRKFRMAHKRIDSRLRAAEIAVQLMTDRYCDGFARCRPDASRKPQRFGWQDFEWTIALEGKLPSDGRRANNVQNVLREFFSRKTHLGCDEFDPDTLPNLRKEFWRKSLPALNLALAVKCIGERMLLTISESERQSRTWLDFMISNPNWVAEAVTAAEFWRKLLPKLLPECSKIDMPHFSPWQAERAA